MKTALLLTLLSLFSSSAAWATNYFDKEETCLQKSDVEAVQSHFTQFKRFTNQSSDKICKGEGIDSKWFDVLRNVLAMQRLTLTDQLQRDENDELTLRPIPQKDWWGYFTQRADRFVIEPAYCSSNENIVAYVHFFARGRINLCPKFFEKGAADQIEVLMHEVRHFDGHSHVTCTQGNENGNRGACDNTINSAGSYAISVQAAVELSFVEQLSDEERLMSEASAIYSVNNKFNSLPTVKSEDYIYLSNSAGEVHRSKASDLSDTQFVTTLDSPARIFSNGSQFTVFPMDPSKMAYRVSKGFEFKVDAIGAFANQYNSEDEHERSLYSGINYFGVGAIAKDDKLYAFCGQNATSLSSFSFEGGAIKSVFNLKPNNGTDENYVLGESGNVYDLKCDNETGKFSSTKVDLDFPRDTVDGFSFKNGLAFLLVESGELLSYDFDRDEINSTGLPSDSWQSATPFQVYRVFDDASAE